VYLIEESNEEAASVMMKHSFSHLTLLFLAYLITLINSDISPVVIVQLRPTEIPKASKHRNAVLSEGGRIISMPVRAAHRLIRKPIRDLDFWGKVIQIYSSYKISQIQSRLLVAESFFRRRGTDDEKREDMWGRVHEVNSRRMMNLCLGLRGFYLKSGQFLGTRHDFMPPNYTSKLSKLHDSVPPLGAEEIRRVLEEELGGPVEDFFKSLDLDTPIGSASVAQVHVGIWRETGEKCAVKIQYPNAERLMIGDLKNLRFLAEFLQRTELKFDVLSAIIELQKQIVNEFDFISEARNMNTVRQGLSKSVREVSIPRSIFSTRKALVMTFIDGENICRLAEFKDKNGPAAMPKWLQKQYGKSLLTILAKAWGEQIFQLRMFNADPHPGNICIDKKSRKVGLLDWGQVKIVSDQLAVNFSFMIQAMNSRNQDEIVKSFFRLGVEVSNPKDLQSIADIAVTMLDTRVVPGYIIDPFNPNNALKRNAVSKMPSDLYFVVRTVQLLRGIACAFDIDYSLSSAWAPYADRIIKKYPALH
jgi:aarF domain-containing kinase